MRFQWPIVIDPMMFDNSSQDYGTIIQICKGDLSGKHARKKGGQDIMATGGRYDQLIKSFKDLQYSFNRTDEISYGAGISIGFSKLLSEIEESEVQDEGSKWVMDVAVYCEPQREGDELLSVLKKLWTLNLKVAPCGLLGFAETLDSCRECSIKYIVALRDNDRGSVSIFTFDSWDRYQDKKMSVQDFLDNKQLFLENKQKSTEGSLPVMYRSDNRIYVSNDTSLSNASTNVDFTFLAYDKEKMSGSSKRQWKTSILQHIQSILNMFSNKVSVMVMPVHLEFSALKKIGIMLEVDEDDQEFQRNVLSIIDE